MATGDIGRTCSKCGRGLPADASFCPDCGTVYRELPRSGTSSGVWVAVAVVAVVVLIPLGLAVTCMLRVREVVEDAAEFIDEAIEEQQQARAAELAKYPGAEIVSAKEIAKAYEANPARADATYLDEVIAVRGRVLRVDSEPSSYLSTYLVEVESDGTPVECGFEEKSREQVAKLEQGETATIVGVCVGYEDGHGPVLKRCQVRD